MTEKEKMLAGSLGSVGESNVRRDALLGTRVTRDVFCTCDNSSGNIDNKALGHTVYLCIS